MQLLTLVMIVSMAILPISRPKHPRVSVVSRGPEKLRVTRHDSYSAALAEAKQRSSLHKRVLVLPFTVEGEDSRFLSESLQMELIRDLQHPADLSVVDIFSYRHILPARMTSASDERQAATTFAADIVITGTVQLADGELVTKVQASPSGQAIKPVAITVRSKGNDFFEVSNQITSGLLTEWKVDLSEGQRRSMLAIPTSVDAAREHCDRAILALIEWNAASAGSDPQKKLRQAADEAAAAIKADRNYLRAYLAAASVAEALENNAERTQFLRAGRNRIRPKTSTDERMVLELEADYALFVQNDRIAARKKYVEILKLCPNDALALWKAIELIGEQTEGQSLSAGDYELATRYAARLQVAHPYSPLTRLLAGSD
jgi:TolB-like protein